MFSETFTLKIYQLSGDIGHSTPTPPTYSWDIIFGPVLVEAMMSVNVFWAHTVQCSPLMLSFSASNLVLHFRENWLIVIFWSFA